jgi:hypothetical protein
MINHDSSHDDSGNVNKTCCCQESIRVETKRDWKSSQDELTRLKYQSTADLDIPTVASWFYSLVGTNERADDKCSGFTNAVEASELNRHPTALKEGSARRPQAGLSIIDYRRKA